VSDILERLSLDNIERQQQLTDSHQRNLPFNELITDRWERAKMLGFDEGASIYNSAYVYGQVHAGKATWIGPNVILDGSGGPVKIGAYCSISAGVHVYTHDTIQWALTGGLSDKFTASVSIGDNCHIGAQSIIKAGIKIGNRCVIGANTFVNKDVPDNSIVVGSPCRIIGRVHVNQEQVNFEYFK
jgi:acetyltransferase-like isoleucine patch superfamily enzyme